MTTAETWIVNAVTAAAISAAAITSGAGPAAADDKRHAARLSRASRPSPSSRGRCRTRTARHSPSPARRSTSSRSPSRASIANDPAGTPRVTGSARTATARTTATSRTTATTVQPGPPPARRSARSKSGPPARHLLCRTLPAARRLGLCACRNTAPASAAAIYGQATGSTRNSACAMQASACAAGKPGTSSGRLNLPHTGPQIWGWTGSSLHPLFSRFRPHRQGHSHGTDPPPISPSKPPPMAHRRPLRRRRGRGGARPARRPRHRRRRPAGPCPHPARPERFRSASPPRGARRSLPRLVGCAEVGVGHASVEEIDTINILRASHLAMGRAVAAADRCRRSCADRRQHDPARSALPGRGRDRRAMRAACPSPPPRSSPR